jgi:hypothetical protein
MNIEQAAVFAIEKAAQRGVDLVKKRIQSQGKAYDDTLFSPYSTEYGEKRVLNGRQVQIKDFTFTGKMLADFKILEVKFSGNIVSATIGMSEERNRVIVGAQSKREGALIIEPSQSELNEMARIFANELQNMITLKI